MIRKSLFLGALEVILNPYGKWGFLKSVVRNGKILDVGCGNNSPLYTKHKRPDINYTGIDIAVYNQITEYEKYAARFILTSPENFHLEIEQFTEKFDAVISAHNLEHCNNYKGVLLAMIKSLKKDGKIFLSFPCEKSTTFPKGRGGLNFYDDSTHINIINFNEIIKILKENNIVIDFSVQQSKPLGLFIIGLVLEPISRICNKIAPFRTTWALYGFETIIIGHKTETGLEI